MENLNDDDTYMVERAPIKLTPYDRRLKEFRDLSEKRNELASHPDSQRRIAQLDLLIEQARKRLEIEKQRSTDDAWRRRRDIDDWRSRDGMQANCCTMPSYRRCSGPNNMGGT